MILSLKDINKHYLIKNKVVTALNKINLDIYGVGLVLISGSSGSGKTTLLNIISGTDFYTEGDYYINEFDTASFTDEEWELTRNKYFGFVYQDFKLIEDYTVIDNIKLAYNVTQNNNTNIASIIKRTGLELIQNKKVKYLSGGQKQRVAIARALAKNTPVILADEPTANLDQKSSKDIAELLYEISKEKLVIIATHNEKLFNSYEKRIITISDGKIIIDENPFNKKEVLEDETKGVLENKNNFIGLFKNFKTGFWTFFSLLFTFLITLGVFSIGLYFINGSKSYYYQTELFYNLNSDRYVVTKHDYSSFSIDEINSISSNPNIKNISKNDILCDSFLVSQANYNTTLSLHLKRRSELPKDYMGVMPQKEDEIIIANEHGLSYENFPKDSIKEYYVSDDYSYVLKIRDFFKIDSTIPVAYIDDNLYTILNNELLLKTSTPTLENEGSKYNNFSFYLDNECPKDILLSDISTLANDSYYVNFTFLNNTLKSDKLNVYEISEYENLAFKYSSRDKYVICNPELFYEITANNIFQLNIYSDKQLSLDSKYNVLYPNAINDGSINSKAAFSLLVWFLLIFILASILVITTYLFLKNIYKKEVRNIYIRRLLGYTKKDCFYFEILKIAIPEILAILNFIIYYLISIYSPLKRHIFVLFSNLPLSITLILLLLSSSFILFLLLRFILIKSNPYKYAEETK